MDGAVADADVNTGDCVSRSGTARLRRQETGNQQVLNSLLN